MFYPNSREQFFANHGTVKGANGKEKLGNVKITAIQNDEKFEQSTDIDGGFELLVNPGFAKIIYQAPGYGRLEDTIVFEGKENKIINKHIQKNSVSG